MDMDGAGTIWVVFRQNFEYGATPRATARSPARSRGDTVGAGQLVDNMGNAPTEGRDFQQIDVNGAGQGLLSHHGNLTNGLEWASLAGGTWTQERPREPERQRQRSRRRPRARRERLRVDRLRVQVGGGVNTARRGPPSAGSGPQTVLSNPAFGAVIGAARRVRRVGAFAAAAFVQQVGQRRDDESVGRRGRRPAAPPETGWGGNPATAARRHHEAERHSVPLTRRRFRVGGPARSSGGRQSEDGRVTQRLRAARARPVRGRVQSRDDAFQVRRPAATGCGSGAASTCGTR